MSHFHSKVILLCAFVACARTGLDGASAQVSDNSTGGLTLLVGGTTHVGSTQAGALTLGGAPGSGGLATTGGSAFKMATGGTKATPTGGAGTGGAGTGGAGTGGSRGTTCDVTVRAPDSVQAAIDGAPSPGTVCVTAGLYKENLQLRDGVNIRGSGPDALLCGTTHADAAVALGVELSQLSLLEVTAVGPVHLNLHDLDITQPSPTGCGWQSQGSVRIKRQGPGSLRFSANNVRVGSPGFYVSIMPAGSPLDDEIQITQSRCVPSSNQCYSFVQLELETQPAEQLALGSRLSVEVSNNLVDDIVLEGIILNLPVTAHAEDTSQLRVMVRHNTLISRGDWNYAISFWVTPGLPVVIANNAIAYISYPVYHADTPQVVQSANIVSSDASSKSWFENFDSANFLPSVGSPLIAAGDATYGISIDIDGHARSDHFDVGAYQR